MKAHRYWFRFVFFLSILSYGASIWSQTQSTSNTGTLLRGIPEACYLIVVNPTLTTPDNSAPDSQSMLNAVKSAAHWRAEIDPEIQSMLARFGIPLSICTTESYPQLANIRITVNMAHKNDSTGEVSSHVLTQVFDSVRSLHTDKISKVTVFSSDFKRQSLSTDDVKKLVLEDVLKQLYLAASAFRQQNSD